VTGKLRAAEVRDILAGSSLSAIQVETIMHEAHISGDGTISYAKFARVCAVMAGDFWGGMPPQDKGFNEMTKEEMEVFLKQMYVAADTDNSGFLDETEMVALLGSSGLGLTRKAIRKVMEEADTNSDGLIEYAEFVPLMANVFASLEVIEDAQQSQDKEYAAAAAATELLFESARPEQVDEQIRLMFSTADTNGNGELDRTEFMEAMRQLDFGLSRKEINALMSEIDKNKDRKINYEEFVPLARDILHSIITDKYMDDHGRHAHLMSFFLKLFSEADPECSGRLSLNTVREILVNSGWSYLQVETVCMDAVPDPQGLINYRKFARLVADCAAGFNSGLAPSATQREVRKARLVALFRRVDVDSSGRISTTELESFIKRLAAKFRHVMSKEDVAKAVGCFQGAPVSEEQFVEYFMEVYAGVEDENFLAFLDFCDTASYGARARRLRTLFWKLDTDGSGVVEAYELKDYVRKLGAKFGMEIRDEDMDFAISEYQFIDRNGDGPITEEEFITVLLEMFDNVSDEVFVSTIDEFDVYSEGDRMVIFANMFARHDLDHDGFLDSHEVREYFRRFAVKMNTQATDADLDGWVRDFQLVDTNGDGKVSKDEFVAFFMAETGNMSDSEFYANIGFFDT
jgi:Ca2+-binding EF-hand superfamily protein